MKPDSLEKNPKDYHKIIQAFKIHLQDQNAIEDVCWSIAKDVIAQLNLEDCIVYLIEDDLLIQKAAHGAKTQLP